MMTGGNRSARRTLGRIALVAASVALTGCALTGCALAGVGVEPLDHPLKASQLVGHWTADSRCPRTTLDLAADGTGKVQRFPTGDAPGGLAVTSTVTGPVQWTQEPGSGDADFPASLNLASGPQNYDLDYGHDDHGFVLVATVGDPDDGVACVYHRAAVTR